MAYEIPQALRYEEKIIFGLTFRQLAYVGVAGLLCVILFKSSLPLFAKIPLMVFFMILGGTMAFLKMDDRLFNMFRYFKSPRNLGYLDSRMSSFIGVKDISDDVIVCQDGSIRAVLQVMPINFTIRSQEDRDAIIKNFQRFLNSLDFPIQILVRTVNLNLDSYIEYLRSTIGKKVLKRKSQNLKEMFEDYCKFLSKYIEENAVQDRLFYLIVPGRFVKGKQKENKSNALDEIKIRVQVCKEGLATAGLVSRQLSTSQLVSLLASFFEGYIEVENDYMFPLTLFKKFEESRNVIQN